VAAHDLALLLQRTGRREAIFTDKRKRTFLIHLFVYVAVNALLIVVNLLYTPGYHWFLLPLIGWGLLVAAHGYLAYFRQRRHSTRRPQSTRRPAATRPGAKT
ncbi:MAG: 2TM domain-containing protein, partial [Methyloceanibacter sp.]